MECLFKGDKMAAQKLEPLSGYKQLSGPVVTIVMDGVGLGPEDESNGVYMANTPFLDELLNTRLMLKIKAHGTAVGLPTDEDMGNSEVGHNALGAGRIFSQGVQLVNDAIGSGAAFSGKSWGRIRECAQNNGTVHFIGLVSDGNVHSNINQLYALLEQCSVESFKRVRVHTLLDGRDVEPKSALEYIRPLEKKLEQLSHNDFDYRIASGGGRMVTTMDRYNSDWSIVEQGWKAHVLGEGRRFKSAGEAVEVYYAEDHELMDQYMPSFVVAENDIPVGTIEDGDAVIFFNFRGDRAIEISRAFEEDDFSEFDRIRSPEIFYAGIMQYDGDAKIPRNYLVEPPAIDNTLGEYLCAAGVSSYAISETQKFGHVTYFWNGNKTGYIDEKYEKYVEIPSDKVTFDERPWMKAAEITDKVIDAIQTGQYDFIRLNFANADMVGHTGFTASIRIAVETVDICLKRLLGTIRDAGGIAIITADHGNADCMWREKNGKIIPMVAHTLSPVPFVVRDFSGLNTFVLADVKEPGLANVAATICTLLGYQQPEEFEPALLQLENK
jgi:2,3-bisphosphoglycerate-independent phosphoglycerate mutase